jgi:hypothetical protein
MSKRVGFVCKYRDRDFTGKDLHPVHYNARRHSFSTSELRQRVKEKSR